MTTQPPLVAALSPNRIGVMHADGVSPSKTDLERLFGRSDLLDLNYFWRGLIAAKSVARIVLRNDANGAPVGYASGFMVSPRLMLTNHHVFREAQEAMYSLAEFDDARGLMGEAPSPVRFAFQPSEYFINDEQLDFALVAVAPASEDQAVGLEHFSWLRLNPTPGKELVGESVSIIQHPQAEPTQIAVRENQITEILPNILRYQTDTQPGSSGSPVFNDSWQVVALHHSAVPGSDGNYICNEGIRVSALMNFLAASGDQHPLLQELMACAHTEKPWDAHLLCADVGRELNARHELRRSPAGTPGAISSSRPVPGGVMVTVPVEVFIGIPGMGTPALPAAAPAPARSSTVSSTWAAPRPQPAPAIEKLVFDTDYSNRTGYDPDFLGIRVELPDFTPATAAQLVTFADGGRWLPYHHFSVATNHGRKLPHVVVTNVDYGPRQRLDVARKDFGSDQWIADPRLGLDAQTTARDHVYSDPNIDYGHVNRREDNCWGDDLAAVTAANSDTFHFTNCTPQHKAFNRSNLKGLWGELENQVALQARDAYPRLSILAGPVLDDSDSAIGQVPAGYQVPRRFWKVVVALSDAGDSVRAYGFMLDQRAAFGLPQEEFDPGAFKAYLVALPEIEQATGLRFPAVLHEGDVQAGSASVELCGSEWCMEVARRLPLRPPARAYQPAAGAAHH